MKDCLNNKLKQKINKNNKTLGEVEIFRTMSDCFKDIDSLNVESAFIIKETHQKINATYKSPALARAKITKEIADLMTIVICNNKIKNCIRISFMQAKWTGKKNAVPLKSFKGDYFQWELLHERPNDIEISNSGEAIHLPKNVFSKTSYKSISNFGVFYKDIYGEIDMLYAIPELISPTCIPDSKCKWEKTFIPLHYLAPCYLLENDFCSDPLHILCCPIRNISSAQNHKEIIYTHDINKYAEYMLDGFIGSPVTENKLLIESLILYVNQLKKHTEEEQDPENKKADLKVLEVLLGSLDGLRADNKSETDRNESKCSGIVPTMIINITNHKVKTEE